MKQYRVIGAMSGTSLDGMDLVLVEFKLDSSWTYHIIHCETVSYSAEWQARLAFINVSKLSGIELQKLEAEYSELLASSITTFIKEHGLKKDEIDFISSHGHTLFHEPNLGYTLQIGKGSIISALSGLAVWSDFRTSDIALGGQGAPLVPIGDRLLFTNYEACLNLGGIANISFKTKTAEMAYDICVCNLALNYLANALGKPFDDSGKLAGLGRPNKTLLKALNQLSYYSLEAPKSLGAEWLNKEFIPLLEAASISIHDKLATVTEHIAVQLAQHFTKHQLKQVLVTGGGAYNTYLLHRVKQHSSIEIVLPDSPTIEYKEALIFGFLGVLANRQEVNVYSIYTGAKTNHIAGTYASKPLKV